MDEATWPTDTRRVFPSESALAECEQQGQLQLRTVYPWILDNCSDDDVREFIARLHLVNRAFRRAIEQWFVAQFSRDNSWLDQFDTLALCDNRLRIFRTCRSLVELGRLTFRREQLDEIEAVSVLRQLPPATLSQLTHLDLRDWWQPLNTQDGTTLPNPLYRLFGTPASPEMKQLEHLAADAGAIRILEGVHIGRFAHKFPKLRTFSFTAMGDSGVFRLPDVIQARATRLYLSGVSVERSLWLDVATHLVIERGSYRRIRGAQIETFEGREVALGGELELPNCRYFRLSDSMVSQPVRLTRAKQVRLEGVEIEELSLPAAEWVSVVYVEGLRSLYSPFAQRVCWLRSGPLLDFLYWNPAAAGVCLSHAADEQREGEAECDACGEMDQLIQQLAATAL